ncbi:hypothetical protein LTR85_009582 [Meristemomyces frigidus]|nr:hypothetical protein LTR85_009582 [Meristemomyces frigidus]
MRASIDATASPTLMQDRMYRFIADPAHKENLSGRVSAACLNCRRKKIKCSGEVDCRQCQEKGLVCEGPPSRKRPKNAASGAGDATLSNNEQCPAATGGEEDGRQYAQPRPPVTLPNEDSGYSSHEHGPRRTSSNPRSSSGDAASVQPDQPADAPAMPSASRNATHHPMMSALPSDLTSPFAFNTSVLRHRSTNDESPTTVSPEDWSYIPHSNASMHSYHNVPPAPPGSQNRSYHIPHPALSNVTAGSMDWNRRNSNEWWSNEPGNAQASAELITAAEALEDQAQSLRRQAARQQSSESEGVRSQTVSQSPHSKGPMQATFYDPILRPPSQFDASVYFHPDGSLRSGLTPGINQFPSTWSMGGGLHVMEQQNAGDGMAAVKDQDSSANQNPRAPGSLGSAGARSSASQ